MEIAELPSEIYGESRVKKWLICSWKHWDHRCYPESWSRGLDGPWHCTLCHPCNKDFDKLLGREPVSRFKFYVEKFQFMLTFARLWEWKLFQEEWQITYAEMLDAKARLPEIEREALGRLLKEAEREALESLRENTRV